MANPAPDPNPAPAPDPAPAPESDRNPSLLPQLRYGNDGVEKPEKDDLEDCVPRTQLHPNISDGFSPRIDYGYVLPPVTLLPPVHPAPIPYPAACVPRYIVSSDVVDMPCGLHAGWVYDDVVRVLNASGGPVGSPWEHAAWDTKPAKLLNSTDERFISCAPSAPRNTPPHHVTHTRAPPHPSAPLRTPPHPSAPRTGRWMRTSPFAVRKPLLLFKGGLRAGTYDLAIENHYDSAIFRGRKALVLAEFSGPTGGAR